MPWTISIFTKWIPNPGSPQIIGISWYPMKILSIQAEPQQHTPSAPPNSSSRLATVDCLRLAYIVAGQFIRLVPVGMVKIAHVFPVGKWGISSTLCLVGGVRRVKILGQLPALKQRHVHRDTLIHRDTPIRETPNVCWNKLFVRAYAWYPTHLSIYASCARLKPKSMLIYAHGLIHYQFCLNIFLHASLYSSKHPSISSSIWKFCSTWAKLMTHMMINHHIQSTTLTLERWWDVINDMA